MVQEAKWLINPVDHPAEGHMEGNGIKITKTEWEEFKDKPPDVCLCLTQTLTHASTGSSRWKGRSFKARAVKGKYPAQGSVCI